MSKMFSRKMTSLLLAVAVVLPSLLSMFAALPPSVFAAAPTEYLGEVDVKPIQAGRNLVRLDGDVFPDFNFDYIAYTDKDGKNWPAYCIQPNKPGASYALGGYTVDASTLLNNAQVYGAIMNGHPFKTPAELGVNDEYEAYYVTKLTIWSIVHPRYTQIDDFTANGSANQHIIDAFRALRAKAMATTSMGGGSGGGTISASSSGDMETVGNNKEQTFTVTPSTAAFTVAVKGTAPTGTKITDLSGVAKSSFSAGEKFKVVIPKSAITSTGSFDLTITATGGDANVMILEGVPTQNANDKQNYALIYNATPTGTAKVNYRVDDVVETPTPTPSFTPPPTPSPSPKPSAPPPPPTSVKIQKIDALTRQNIPGALVRLRGISSAQVVTEDGQIREIDNTGINLSQVLTAGATVGGGDVTSTVTDGVWELTGLPYGAYVAEEERAPANYSLLPQHTSYSFWLLPGNVTIKLNQDESTVYVDDVQVSVHEAMNAAIAGIQNFDDAEALAKELQDILDTLLSQLKVDAVFTVEVDQSVNSQLITFENYPFGKIEVYKYDMVTEFPLAGAHFRLQGYFAEGNTNGMPIDRVGITDGSGKLVFEDLPAGQYTISEIEAPDGYELSKPSFRSISLTWGQTNSTSFYNKPKTRLEVIKVDGDTNVKLAGAIFRLTDPTTGEFWEGETAADGRVLLGSGDGSRGNQLESETTYILTEIQAPPGYVLDPAPREVVLGANNLPNSLTFANFKKPTLTVIKLDELTNLPLVGASFRLWKTEGETWSETQITGADGKITWTALDPGIYSVQEIDEPYGYFKDPSRKEILLKGGDNKVLEFFNRPRPILTILKRDAITGAPLQNVKFRVQKLEGATIGEFLTDANGRIELSPRTGYLLDEAVYRVTEVLPPNEYLLSANPQKDVLLKWYEPTELVYENVLKPTLIFIKRDGMSGRGISGATYKVEYESPTGGVTNIGSYVTKCGLIVIPHVLPGWYSLTETSPATGYQLPTNPTVRIHLAPGENSYTYAQTHEDLYVDPRTNPNSGSRGMCGDWCGYLCSVLCAGNCGNAGDGTMASGGGGTFGNMVITNGNGQTIGGSANGNSGATPTPTPSTTKPTLTLGAVTRNSDLSATITFTASAAGRYYYVVTNSGTAEPTIATSGNGTASVAGANTITVYMTSGAKDVYIKVKDAVGNVSDALKIAVPAYSTASPSPSPSPATSDAPPDFSNIKIQGGTVVYLSPDPLFSGIVIKFGGY